MRRLAVSVWCFLLVVLAGCSRQQLPEPATFSTQSSHITSELYFSEYVEGSDNNKALEIYNGTLDDVPLSEYRVEIYYNGNSDPGRTVDLKGVLAAGDAFVVATVDAGPEILALADLTGGCCWFNGDDAIVLRRGDAVADAIGQVGVDPGEVWGNEQIGTAELTLRRNPNVCVGDTDAYGAFDPALQWAAVARDTFDGLGTHEEKCVAADRAASPEPQPEPDPVGTIPIYEIQGAGESSPLDGSEVTIQGVVAGDFQEYGSLGGFFVQDLEGDGLEDTSDGIFVYHYDTDVEVGDLVEVRGRVDEYHGLTELTDVEMVEVSGKASAEATVVTLPLQEGSGWERYEGMLVELKSASGPLVATEVYHLGRGGLVMLADERLVQYTQANLPSEAGYEEHRESLERRTILLDDGSLDQNPDPIRYSATGDELTAHDTLRVGDTTSSVIGVITYSWSGEGWYGTDAYRIHPTEAVDFTPANPRPNQVPDVGGDLQVASFNVLNFFNGDGHGGGFPTPRGADNEFELERQLDKLIAAIVPLDAEVLGLIEIENDAGSQSALADLVRRLNNELDGQNRYDYIETGVIGTDEIRVALIYQPAEVSPAGHYRVLTSEVDPRFVDTKNRPALAQTFVAEDSGARFTVIVNHLKSKGSSCADLGDADTGDGQGNCNETRTAAAEALADWAEQLAEEAEDPDVLIMGDLNSYAMEDPIRVLVSSGFEDLLEPDEFTYVFSGESGTLDHALATPGLADQVTDAAVWRINTEEPSVLDYDADYKSDRHVELLYDDSPFRSSDHDPVIIGLDLEPPRGRGIR
ncbi:MAG TPA: ExeM/NucH family extracellular endonuclease [Trueperaceae bacterium]